MSARRAFDIGRKQPVSKNKPKKTRQPSRKKTAPPPKKPQKKLRARRESERARNRFLTLVVLGCIAGGTLFLLWRPEIRIQHVHANTEEDARAMESLVQEHMEGTFHYIIPKNSFFFYPKHSIQQAVLDAYPRVANVSVSRDGFNTIYIDTTVREPAFIWCGTPDDARETCYYTDTTGYIFEQSDTASASSTILSIQGFIDTASTTDSYPLRARVIGFEHLPAVSAFIQSVEALGTPIVSVSIREDEIDLFAQSGTRITYVLGQEEQAEKDARASFPTFNLMDGSLQYVDLRFPGKVYLKRNE